MAIFEWKSEYDTGVEEIDNQHKVLVSLINELSGLVGDNFDRGAAEDVFNKLKNYTVFHFATEESLMAQYHYAERDLHAHLLQHRQFEEEIASVQHDFSQISIEDCNVILSYLTNWLINHICKVDKRFSSFILGKRQAEALQHMEQSNEDIYSETDHKVARSSDGSGGGANRYLAIAREHIAGSDDMLYELEVCIGELRGHCDTLVKTATERSQSQVPDEAYTFCVQGTYLVKSLQNKQTKLKELLDEIDSKLT